MTALSFVRTIAAACAVAFASQASAAVLTVHDGILTGATNVSIGGDFYDVQFVDGSCNSLFNGCNASAFTFTTEATAMAASRALLDQVFVDGPAGNFDSVTNKIAGCTYAGRCIAIVPFARDSINTRFSATDNYADNNLDAFAPPNVRKRGGHYQLRAYHLRRV